MKRRSKSSHVWDILNTDLILFAKGHMVYVESGSERMRTGCGLAIQLDLRILPTVQYIHTALLQVPDSLLIRPLFKQHDYNTSKHCYHALVLCSIGSHRGEGMFISAYPIYVPHCSSFSLRCINPYLLFVGQHLLLGFARG